MTQVTAEGAAPEWTLGDRLRKAREHSRLKQAELAEEIGISRASVVNYETGRYQPSRPILLSWALRCGVDYGWLTGHPSPQPAIPTAPLHITNSVLVRPAFTWGAGLRRAA